MWKRSIHFTEPFTTNILTFKKGSRAIKVNSRAKNLLKLMSVSQKKKIVKMFYFQCVQLAVLVLAAVIPTVVFVFHNVSGPSCSPSSVGLFPGFCVECGFSEMTDF